MIPKIIVVTPGDPDGIGPEIVHASIRSGAFNDLGIRLLIVGAKEPFEKLGLLSTDKILDPKEALLPGHALTPPSTASALWILPAPKGKPGFQSGWSIEEATRLVFEKKALALVTGPISKERLQAGGYPFPGHTEFLSVLCEKFKKKSKAYPKKFPPVTMMLANDQLRVSLATLHLALKDVPRKLTKPELVRAIDQTIEFLQNRWKIRKPKVAVLGLNPHAGENGILGKEEKKLIIPTVKQLSKRYRGKAEILGPFPSDTYFAKHVLAKPEDKADAVVAMYHDQGLIPVKLLDFHRTVNVTLGLPIIRTSVDHGVGFDIAGKGIANPTSFQSAVRLAIEFLKESS